MAEKRNKPTRYTGIYWRLSADPTRKFNRRPDKAFDYCFRENGKLKWECAGWLSTGMSEELASQQRLQKILRSKNPEAYVAAHPEPVVKEAVAVKTFGELAENYFVDMEGENKHASKERNRRRMNEESIQYLQPLIIEREPQITLFIGHAPFQLQKAHLQSLLEAYLPDGNCTHLRLYNDLVFRRLFSGCTAEDVAQILGPSATVIYPGEPGEAKNREPQWLHADNPGNAASQHLVDTYTLRESPWFQLRDEHFTEFAEAMHLVLIDNIVQDLWYRDTPHAADINRKYGTIEEFAGTCVHEGQAFGLETYEDLQAYAFLMAEHEAVSGRKELAGEIMITGAATGARLAELRAALYGRTAL